MDQNKFRKIAGAALVASAAIVTGMGADMTYHTVHGQPNQTIAEVITSHSKQAARQAEEREHIMDNKPARGNQVIKRYRTQPSRQDEKRLPVVAKYINTNDLTHGLKHVSYDKRNHRLIFSFDKRVPVNTRTQVERRLEAKFSAE